MSDTDLVTKNQKNYYESLLKEHGPSVHAVASASQVYKNTRYDKLSKVFDTDDVFTIHDVGCGIGHYYEYLKENHPGKDIKYSGTEITDKFVQFCKNKYPESDFYLRDLSISPYSEKYDYLIYGGTFYHMAGSDKDAYFEFVKKMIKNGFDSANKGISFNLITEFVDYEVDDLFYCKMGDLIEFLVKDVSRYFKIDHSSPLYEYTVSLYHESYLKEKYTDAEFDKYYRS